MDASKQILHNMLEGPGGFKCPCCWPYHGKKGKKITTKLIRSRLKQSFKKTLKEEV